VVPTWLKEAAERPAAVPHSFAFDIGPIQTLKKEPDIFTITTAKTKAGTVGQVVYRNEIKWESEPYTDILRTEGHHDYAVDLARTAAQAKIDEVITALFDTPTPTLKVAA
jgi:hypothetical protein